jgi:hypothetical protein
MIASKKKTKLIHGIGVNDAAYAVCPAVDGKVVTCPYYLSWRNMITRCYSARFHEVCPTYAGCSVVKEWHSFVAFRAWMTTQDFEGKHLDKDILVEGNKIYGPDTCVFVDSQTNKLLTDRAADRGDLPIGVTMNRSRYQAQCSQNGSQKNLGLYDTAEQASAAYRAFKAEVIMEAALQQPDPRVHDALFLRSLIMAAT